jgi:hypothetical protein
MEGSRRLSRSAVGATVTRMLTKDKALAARRGDAGLNCILGLPRFWTRLR